MVLNDQLDALGIDVQDAAFLLVFGDLLDGGEGGTVAIAAELGMFDKLALLDHRGELLPTHEMVGHPVLFARPRLSCRVRNGEPEETPILRRLQFLDQCGLAAAGRTEDDDRLE